MPRPILLLVLLVVTSLSRAQLVPDFSELEAAASAPAESHVRPSLISERVSFVPGETLRLAIRMEMDDHWHTYWANYGEAGMETRVNWNLPEGFRAGPLQFPVPKRLEEEGIVTFIHEGVVFLSVDVETPHNLPPGPVVLEADVEWLECKDVCIPGAATLHLELRAVEKDPVWSEAGRRMLSTASEHIPRPLADDVLPVWHQEGERLTIRIPGEGRGTPREFFPLDALVWDYTRPFSVKADNEGLLIEGHLQSAPQIPERVSGVLVLDDGAVTISAQRENRALPTSAEPPRRLGSVLLAAFLGGLILNLMPCVFPVLSLKISGFVHQAHGNPRRALLHGLAFAVGILLSMWVFAVLVSTLKLAWGEHLQSASANIAITLLLTAVALNLFGLFEVGTRLTTVGSGLTHKEGYAGSFYSGVLATILATPCTGPFMAAAIGWAVTQPMPVVFLMFTLLGLGFASPYVLLSSSTRLLSKVPRPGPWMESFKQSMGFLMMGAAWAWVWILASQIDADHLVRLLGGMLLLALGCWIYGRWCPPHRRRRTRWIGLFAAVLVAGLGIHAAFQTTTVIEEVDPSLRARIEAGEPLHYEALSPDLAATLLADGVPLMWQPFSEERLQALRAAGTPVFVDFTARWCFTCQVNKKTTLHKPEVERAFLNAGVVTLKADWTNEDESIRRTLHSLGRNGVPVYALFPADPPGVPVLLPETLSPGIVVGALQNLKPAVE